MSFDNVSDDSEEFSASIFRVQVAQGENSLAVSLIAFFLILLVLFCIIMYMFVCFVCFCLNLCLMYSFCYVIYSYCYVYVFILICMFRCGYSVSLCCSVYCFV